MSSEQRTALEWRRVSSPPGAVFDAALETLFDQGYLVSLCDRRTGTVVGRLPVRNPRFMESPKQYQQDWGALRHAGNDLTIIAEPGKGVIRVTSMDRGQPDETRVTTFYQSLGEKIKLDPWTTPAASTTAGGAR